MPFEILDESPGGYEILPPAAEPVTRTEKVLRGVRDPLDGAAQLLEKVLPDSFNDANHKVNNWLADKLPSVFAKVPERNLSSLVTGGPTGVDGLIKQQEAEYQAKRAAAGESGFDGYRLLGNVVSPANLAIASRLPAAAATASSLGKVGVGAAGGALSALANPVTDGDYWSEKAKQVGVGAVGGALAPVVTGAVGRVISPNASTNPNLALLKAEGVRPTIGQTLGGVANRAEEKLQSVPIVGDAISAARQRATADFEAAANNRALAPIGMKLPDGLSGRDAVAYTEQALKANYDRVLNSIGALKVDSQFGQSLQSLNGMVNKLMIPKADKMKYQAALADVKAAIDQNGVMTPEAFKSLESTLGADAATLARSPAINDNKVGTAVKQLQAELRDLLKRQAGQQSDELAAANQGWANFKRVQRAAASVGAEDGQFTPAQFQNAVKALDKSKDKGAFARGNALGQDLGDAGKAVLTNKVPNSGTVDRALLGGGALTAGALLDPTIPAGLVGGALAYTPQMQALLRGLVSSRPQGAKAIADALKKPAPLLAPGGAQLVLGLLN